MKIDKNTTIEQLMQLAAQHGWPIGITNTDPNDVKLDFNGWRAVCGESYYKYADNPLEALLAAVEEAEHFLIHPPNGFIV